MSNPWESINLDDLIKEANKLVDKGVKEIILVAQDITKYGEDLYKENKLIELLTKLSKIKKLEWIRLLYCYPEGLTNDLLSFISSTPKICPYIDVPLQHIDDNILQSMNRRLNENSTRQLLNHIKENYPDIRLRSTFIVGYPGETRKKFNKLKTFLNEYKFDFVGFFEYCREENTKAFYLRNQINSFTKKRRKKILEKQQLNIFKLNADKYLNNTYDAIIDEFDISTGKFICRLKYFAPEVDFIVEVDEQNLKVGDIVKIKITQFDNYIFKGEII